jgi:ABC-type uncharacterized transport system substrate-binding protein
VGGLMSHGANLPDGFRRLGIIGNVANSLAVLEMNEVQAGAARFRFEAAALEIRRAEDIGPVFEELRGGADALNTNHARIHTLAMGARLPAIFNAKKRVEAGGLMSYGPNSPELYRRAAEYVDKILRGAKPADIPVEQPTKFDLVVNLTTAKALGLEILRRCSLAPTR